MSLKESSAIEGRQRGSSRLVDHSSLAYLVVLSVLLIFAVLAFGAVETWATSILEIGSALLFAVIVVHKICFSGVQAKWNPLFPPMAGFAMVAAIQLILNLTAYRYETLL